MSQLRNLLTNKVIQYRHGSRRAFAASRGYVLAGVAARIRSEIAERSELAQAHRQEQKIQKVSVLGKISRFLRRVAKGA